MENNQTILELYNIYLKLGHEVFEEKLKNYLHNNHICGSTNCLNTFIAKENLELGEVCLDEYDIFSPPTIEDKNDILADSMESFKLGEVGFDEH